MRCLHFTNLTLWKLSVMQVICLTVFSSLDSTNWHVLHLCFVKSLTHIEIQSKPHVTGQCELLAISPQFPHKQLIANLLPMLPEKDKLKLTGHILHFISVQIIYIHEFSLVLCTIFNMCDCRGTEVEHLLLMHQMLQWQNTAQCPEGKRQRSRHIAIIASVVLLV